MKTPICVSYAACVMVLMCLLGSVAGETGPNVTLGTGNFEPQPINMYLYQVDEGGMKLIFNSCQCIYASGFCWVDITAGAV